MVTEAAVVVEGGDVVSIGDTAVVATALTVVDSDSCSLISVMTVSSDGSVSSHVLNM